MDKIQANLKPETVERIAKIADRPVTRGIDKMINLCIDELEKKQKEENQKFRDCSVAAAPVTVGENKVEE